MTIKFCGIAKVTNIYSVETKWASWTLEIMPHLDQLADEAEDGDDELVGHRATDGLCFIAS